MAALRLHPECGSSLWASQSPRIKRHRVAIISRFRKTCLVAAEEVRGGVGLDVEWGFAGLKLFSYYNDLQPNRLHFKGPHPAPGGGHADADRAADPPRSRTARRTPLPHPTSSRKLKLLSSKSSFRRRARCAEPKSGPRQPPWP